MSIGRSGGEGGIFGMLSVQIDNNNSVDNGGGVYVYEGTFTMQGGNISKNNAARDGGGIYVSSGPFVQDGGGISGNTAARDGGGVFTRSFGEVFIDDNAEYFGNMAARAYRLEASHEDKESDPGVSIAII